MKVRYIDEIIVHQSEVWIQYGQLQLLHHVAPLIHSRNKMR